MLKPERCQDCPFSYFGHDWRDANCRLLKQTISMLLNTEKCDYVISREIFEDVAPRWCPRKGTQKDDG